MSTFDGIVEEFPNIRIDYFRHHPDKTPPAACFLSHVHSDHLLGLESLKMPFVYCSAATRRLLLKMEKYPHRINFSKGILEARKQTYKHLKALLRPLPLQTPVDLQLGPKSRIRVTLYDANHCPGSVMFLIEGDGKAVLYTGDVRAEHWWLQTLVRSPSLIPYVHGQKRLDCIYLDTTFASHQDPYREFPTKAEGLTEMMQKVGKCGENCIFYFRAWTLGYEDVWIMLNNILNSQIHVDPYQLRLFRAIAEDGIAADTGLALAGFPVGNSEQVGCLTADSNVMIHSCEPGMACHQALKRKENVVWITPIISRIKDGTEIAEVGAGGGGGDLYKKREVELGHESVAQALQLFSQAVMPNEETMSNLNTAITAAQNHREYRLMLDGPNLSLDSELTIKEFLKLVAKQNNKPQEANTGTGKDPKMIHFPYSRHSSYSELQGLVRAFQPHEICPCTVDIRNWDEDQSMRFLFGDLCSSNTFRYDAINREEIERRRQANGTAMNMHEKSQETQESETQTASLDQDCYASEDIGKPNVDHKTPDVILNLTTDTREPEGSSDHQDHRNPKDRLRDAWRAANNGSDTYLPEAREDLTRSVSVDGEVEALEGAEDVTMRELTGSESSSVDLAVQREAFEAAQECLQSGDSRRWQDMRLRSLGYEGHTREEPQL